MNDKFDYLIFMMLKDKKLSKDGDCDFTVGENRTRDESIDVSQEEMKSEVHKFLEVAKAKSFAGRKHMRSPPTKLNLS